MNCERGSGRFAASPSVGVGVAGVPIRGTAAGSSGLTNPTRSGGTARTTPAGSCGGSSGCDPANLPGGSQTAAVAGVAGVVDVNAVVAPAGAAGAPASGGLGPDAAAAETLGQVTSADAAGLAELPDPNLLVAFLGDQGDGDDADAVLQLVKSEGAAAVIHNGDFDYMNSPGIWNARIDRILGPNFPYFAVVGNHDAAAWDGVNGAVGYGSLVAARQARVPDMRCQGDPGVRAICHFRGLLMVQSCVGTSELGMHGDCGTDSVEQIGFIHAALASSKPRWAICSWHKNQHDLQVGSKSDEVGWGAYQECMHAGAMIHTAHEHSYSRTYTLSNLTDRAGSYGKLGIAERVELGQGHSFVFVSGLGGSSVRDFDTSHDGDSWWASFYTATRWLKNGQLQSGTGTFGATFMRFFVMGDPRRAWGYFKDVNGRIADEFTITLSSPAR